MKEKPYTVRVSNSNVMMVFDDSFSYNLIKEYK